MTYEPKTTPSIVARRELIKRYPEQYQKLVEKFIYESHIPKGETGAQRTRRKKQCYNFAQTALVHKHHEEYKELCAEAVESGKTVPSLTTSKYLQRLRNKEKEVPIRGIGTAVWSEKCQHYYLELRK